jgi:hypothetical protein
MTPGVFVTAPATKSMSTPALPSASINDAKPVITPNFKFAGFGDF